MVSSIYLNLMWSVLFFPCPILGSCCAILSQVGLPEIPATYLGSLCYILAQGLLLLNGYPSERLILKGGGSKEYDQLRMDSYPKRVHFASLMQTAKY
jgi:hypothetical protein